LLEKPEIETVISAKDDTHLTWQKAGDEFVPNYVQRANRQYLTPVYRETGGFLITRASVIDEHNRIGKKVRLCLLSGGEDVDIDTYEDWQICEYYLRRKKILFVVTGNSEVGLGHVYNTLLLANDILRHQVEFLVDRDSRLACDKIAQKNYPVYMQEQPNMVDEILVRSPHVVINDRLDTVPDDIVPLKNAGIAVINFEDLGDGAKHADLVINAIYPEEEIQPRHYFGHRYFVLRDEFVYAEQPRLRERVANVLLTFGGVDPNNFTRKVLESIYGFCIESGIKITVVAGFGYRRFDTLEPFAGIDVVRNAQNICEYMAQADVIFTSAGRTTYEAASLGVPCIVLAQNARETTHFFASDEHGFENLGLGAAVPDGKILESFRHIVDSFHIRQHMSVLMKKADLKNGRARVNAMVNDVLEQI
jgi:spore coat polysaccharide biosynthesis predicted glycosyltransferase SpsG